MSSQTVYVKISLLSQRPLAALTVLTARMLIIDSDYVRADSHAGKLRILEQGMPHLDSTTTSRVLRSMLAAPQYCRTVHALEVFANLKLTSKVFFPCITANTAMRRSFSNYDVGKSHTLGLYLSRTNRSYSDWQRYRRRYRRLRGCGRLSKVSERCKQRGAVDRGRRQLRERPLDRNGWHAFLFTPQQLHNYICDCVSEPQVT